MVKYEVLILVNSLFLFFARFLTGLIFYYNDFKNTAYEFFLLAIFYLAFLILLYIGRKLYRSFGEKNYFYNKYRKILNGKKSFKSSLFKKIIRVNFVSVRHYVWYLFQLESIFTATYFSLSIGWGYGFDLYLIMLTSYYYLNLRKYSPLIFLFPFVYFVIYLFIFFYSSKVYQEPGQVIIYVINIIFVISAIFFTQIIMELGQVIRFVNDENRKNHLKRLTSFDTLTETYHKYSFLEIMNAKLEHNADEDVITQASVIVIEINNLRKINEEYTTELGNEVLKEFAYILRKHSENYEKYISRWSGNEFLVFIINEDEVVVKSYIDEVKQEAMKNRFGVKGAKVQVIVGLSHTSSFDYQINKFISEAYEELAINRDKLNYEKGDI